MVGVTLTTRFTYRGQNEDYANQYWFTGSEPSSDSAWSALADALILQHKTLIPSTESIVAAAAHNSNVKGSNAVWTKDFTADPNTPVPGTLSLVGMIALSGDTANWIRWKTSRVTSPGGKPIYLRKYIHPAIVVSTGIDATAPGWKTPALAVGAKLRDGTFLDGRTLTAPGHTDTLLGHSVSDWTTTRTLKRRGKRRPTSA